MKTGRNAPCPCGSGKKYKKCCLAKAARPVDLLWRRLGEAHDRMAGALMDFARDHIPGAALAFGVDDFFGWMEEDGMDALDADLEAHGEIFWPWFLYNWVYDPEKVEVPIDYPIGQSIARIYADAHPDRVDSLQQRLIEQTCGNPFSFWEVISVVSGQGMQLRDLLTGDTKNIQEVAASEAVPPGSIVMCRVVTVDHVSMMVGCGTLPIPPEFKDQIEEIRRWILAEYSAMNTSAILAFEMDIIACYLDIFDAFAEDAGDDTEATFPDDVDQRALLKDPEVRRGLEHAIRDHWRRWIDTPLPALSALTPRKAVKTIEGKKAVTRILADAEALMSDDAVMAAMKVNPIDSVRRRLGLEIAPEIASLAKEDRESTAGAVIRGLLVDFCGRFLTYELTTRVFRLCDRLDVGIEFSLSRGRPEIWAASIITAIAQVNFLFDSEDPFGITHDDIHQFFDTKPATVTNKARLIRTTLDMDIGHPDYCTQEIVDAFTFIETPEGFIMPKKVVLGDGPWDDRAAAMAKPRIDALQKARDGRAKKKQPPKQVDDKQLPLFDES